MKPNSLTILRESLTEVRDILRSNTEVLQNVLHRTKTNRRTRQARDSIVASSNLSYSSAITDTEFTFDDEVVNSRVYRRVLHAAARDAGMAGRGPAPNTARRRLSEAPTASDFESQADTIVPSGADSQSTVRRRGSDDASTLINPRRLSTELGRGTSSKKSKPKESRQYKYVQIPPPLPPRQKQPETCPHKAKIGCKLTAVSSCCSCSDKRPQESSYDVYKDGEGLVEDLRRWLNYCPTCVCKSYPPYQRFKTDAQKCIGSMVLKRAINSPSPRTHKPLHQPCLSIQDDGF